MQDRGERMLVPVCRGSVNLLKRVSMMVRRPGKLMIKCPTT